MNSNIELQQGGTVKITFQLRDKNGEYILNQSQFLKIIIINSNGGVVFEASTIDNKIKKVDGSNNKYYTTIPHDSSLGMIGKMTMELAIYDDSQSSVSISKNNVYINFRPNKISNRL